MELIEVKNNKASANVKARRDITKNFLHHLSISENKLFDMEQLLDTLVDEYYSENEVSAEKHSMKREVMKDVRFKISVSVA